MRLKFRSIELQIKASVRFWALGAQGSIQMIERPNTRGHRASRRLTICLIALYNMPDKIRFLHIWALSWNRSRMPSFWPHDSTHFSCSGRLLSSFVRRGWKSFPKSKNFFSRLKFWSKFCLFMTRASVFHVATRLQHTLASKKVYYREQFSPFFRDRTIFRQNRQKLSKSSKFWRILSVHEIEVKKSDKIPHFVPWAIWE